MIIIMAGIAVVKRGWLFHIQNLEGKACSDEETAPVTWVR